MKNNVEYKWEIGYCAINVWDLNPLHFRWLKEKAEQCQKFILGIPNKEVINKIYGAENEYKMELVKAFWNEIKWIDEVVILDFEHLNYRKAFEVHSFDVCFCGSHYGLAFEVDKVFMKEHRVDFISLLPDKLRYAEGINALELPLSQLFLKKKLILFGTGAYFDFFIRTFGEKYKPEYAIDNDKNKWNTYRNGILIKEPLTLQKENPEEVLIVICCKNYEPILQQLYQFGKYDYRTLLYYNEIAILEEARYVKETNRDELVLKKVHEINYGLLKVFDHVCRAHDVQYFLNYGSCLGAIRHKGFIPWDNDVDICMTRDNLEKLLLWVNEFDGLYRFVPIDDFGKKKYFDSVPRLNYKKAYIKMDEDATHYYENRNNGIHLDMFLIDKTYDDFKGKLQRFELAILYGLMNAYRHKMFFFDYSKSMRFANAILRTMGRCIPLEWMRKRVDKVAKRFDNDDKAPYYFISNCALCKLKLLFPADLFNKAIDVPFEDMMAPVPEGYDTFLKLIFGDYMCFPPEEARVPHMGRQLISADNFVFEELTEK